MDKHKRAVEIFFGLLFIVPMGWGLHWLITHEVSRGHWWISVICFGLGFTSTVWKTIKAFCGVSESTS